jgi:DNA-binding MarR family transcriptional regulator
MPTLLRGARTTYTRMVRQALADAGCDDVPRHGAFILGAINRSGSTMGQIISWLGISKQAAGQVVDTLVIRGYLERSPDTQDRRRLSLALTERGDYAAAAIRSAAEQLDTALMGLVGPDNLHTTRTTLLALAAYGQDGGFPGFSEES